MSAAPSPESDARFARVQRHSRARSAGLTDRMIETLEGMAEGLTNREIGAALHLSEDTIKQHVHHMLKLIGARSRTHALAIGFREGWLA